MAPPSAKPDQKVSISGPMDYDTLMGVVGEFGLYQRFVYFSMCVFTILGANQSLSMVFTAAVPDHWCKVPELQNTSLPLEVIKNLSLPRVTSGGEERYSQCKVYDLNYADIVKNEKTMEVITGDRNATDQIECQHGWIYDTSIYKSTIVTDVSIMCDKKKTYL